ncbi:MAG: metalloregulator ArsR/SmtB family transcription factor [Bdellovibrionota bacterium]
MLSSKRINSNMSCADALKILSDETRLGIIVKLLEKPMPVNEINEALSIEQSLLSHHLRVLRLSGFVTSERSGKNVIYRLTQKLKATQSANAVNLGCCRLSFT